MFAAGQADRSDPGCVLVDEDRDEEQVQKGRCGGVLWGVGWCGDWFADGFHARPPLAALQEQGINH